MAKNIIGIDIGGTKITGVLYNGKKVLDGLTIVTPKNLLEFERNLIKLVDFLSAKIKISGVGIGMAGRVDSGRGIIIYSPNIKFINNFNLAKLFTINKIKNVKIENDARCFALAEALFGGGKSSRNVVGVTLGTGIGGGLVAGGKIYRGKKSGAGEAGQMIYQNNQTFEQAFKNSRDQKNNAGLAKITGALLTNIYRLLDPDVIIVGGGVALDKKRDFLNKAISICAKNLSSYKIKPDNIRLSKLKNAGALGAALLVK